MDRVASTPSAAPLAPLSTVARGLVGAFLVSGVVHLVRPQVFTPIVPHALPAPRALVIVSGVAEIVCAVGMLIPSTRRAGGVAAAALLVAVFPANLQMAVDAHRAVTSEPTREHQVRRVISLARLPLQIPLVRAAWSAGRR